MLFTKVFFLITLISLSFSLVPIWKFDQNAVSFFSSDSPNYKEDTVFAYNGYVLKNIYKKNGGTITVEHKLTIYKDTTIEKDVDFSNMQLFEMIRDYGQIICPQGKFMPLDAYGNEITLPISNSQLDWHLKCVGHGTGVFLAFFLNKDSDSLYGYLADKDGKIWDGGNDFHNMLYDLKIKNKELDNNHLYAIVFLALDGTWIKLIGAKQALATNIPVDRANCETKSLFEVKSKTYAFFDDNTDKFYLITYNKDGYSIVYSLKEDIGSYEINDNIKNVGETIKTDLTLPFADKVEIVSMNFINKTPYIYYTIKNLATEKYNYGIMDLLTQQILFNTDQEITNFEPLSNYEMLIFSNGNAYKICLFREGDSCASGCPSGKSLVLNVNGNYCKNSGLEECTLKLVPDNICIDSCDTDIYKLNGNECGLCEYFDSAKPYRLIKTGECLATMPEGTKYYNEKYKLLECASGYQFDNINKLCVPHCYNSCAKCTDYSEDSEDHKCSECKEGYYQNGTNCYEIIIPTTIIKPPTTIIVNYSNSSSNYYY